VEEHGNEVSLVSMANTVGRNVAMMISFQHTGVAQPTVPCPWWHQHLTMGAQMPKMCLRGIWMLSFFCYGQKTCICAPTT